METVKRKTFVQILLTAAVIVLVCLLIPKESTVSTEPEREASVSASQVKQVSRYPARIVTDGTQVARDRYGLPSPLATVVQDIGEYAVGESDKASEAWFDDAVFIGDSVTECLYKTVLRLRAKQQCLGQASFYTAASYGLYEATRSATSDKAIHPYYDGKPCSPSDIVKYEGAGKVYICLGLNDIGLYTTENCLKYYKTLICSIREKSPNVIIYIQSLTPVTLYGEARLLYNAKIDTFNVALAAFAKENGCYYLYISDLMKDTEGYLAYALSSDDNRLLEREACQLWIEYLYTHTGISE